MPQLLRGRHRPGVPARALAPLLITAAALLAAAPAHASLFSDDEARKAIVDLRARLSAIETARLTEVSELRQANVRLTERLAEQTAALGNELAPLRRSLLDLNNQLEALRAEVARLRGSDEQLARDLSEQQRRLRDVAQALEDRMRKLEPVSVSLDGAQFFAMPQERQAYTDALELLRKGEFDKAHAALAAFQRRFPGSGYADSVNFWTGNALYGRRDHKEAISAFRAFITAAPSHPRVPEALLALANSQAEMKDVKSARRTLEDLVKAHPSSEAAAAAKERLATLR